ncbi:hypothetical protein FBU30_001004 [Linnemannia zychae]|nr:hypothetical protein FBU30_001004 [Linnemannia zychae]
MALRTDSVVFLIVLCCWVSLSVAHSPSWPTITYTETLDHLDHDILPRHLNSHDSHPNSFSKASSSHFSKRGVDSSSSSLIERNDRIRLRFQAFNKTFYLHLEPNNELIQPELLKPLSSPSSSSSRMISLASVYDDIKPFKGVVIENDHYSNEKWERAMSPNLAEPHRPTVEQMLYEEGVLGWARMMIEHDEDDDNSIILRGAFTTKDDTYHITSRQSYHIQKRSDDHMPPSSSKISSQLIIYRDSDLRKPTKKLYQRRDFASEEERMVWEEREATACGAGYIASKMGTQNINGTKSSAGVPEYGYYHPPNLTEFIPMERGEGIGPSSFFKMAATKFRKTSNPEDEIMIKVAGPNPVPTGCPAARMINYMGVAADCTYVRSYGGLANARKQIFADFNTASGIYESSFNIALGIISLEIESMNCPKKPVKGKAWNQECSTDYTINDRLSDFSYWRGQRSKDGAGLWHLMTQCSTGPVVGIAWTGALCQMSYQTQGGVSTGAGVAANPTQYTAGTGISSVSPNEWMVVAHEIGHGFGANHDCTTTNCVSSSAIADAACCPYSTTDCDAGNRFIMNPSEQAVKSTFSPCSIHAICSTISSEAGACLQPISASEAKPVQSFEANICGNGIKEEGEECDCGSPAECALDPCCDGATCKFKAGAVCDDLNDDCCHRCQLAPAGQVCRSAVSNCDLAEICTGASASCPPDIQLPNLTPCDILYSNNQTFGKGQCANGLCTSRDLQCAQQQRLGIDRQCGAATGHCELLCNDPSGNPNSCMKIPGMYFIDGSPCGSSGICDSGKCKLPGGWIKNNLSIFIPVICLVIVLIGAGIGIWVYLARRKARRNLNPRSGSFPFQPSRSEDSGGADIDGLSGVPMTKTKDADIPKWMLTGDRHNSQVVVSRRTSLSAQNVLRNAEGNIVPMSTAPELAAIYRQQQQQPLFQSPQQRNDNEREPGEKEYYPDNELYQDMYQSHEELHQQQMKQHRYLRQIYGYQTPTGFMSPMAEYNSSFGNSPSTPPSKQEFEPGQYIPNSPLSSSQMQMPPYPPMQRHQSPQYPPQAARWDQHLNVQQQKQQQQQDRYHRESQYQKQYQQYGESSDGYRHSEGSSSNSPVHPFDIHPNHH